MSAVAWLMAASAMWQQSSPTTRPDSLADSTSASQRPAAIGPLLPTIPARVEPVAFGADTARQQQRPRAIEYSHLYEVRAAIHHYASFATLPLFAAEYALGQSLYRNQGANSSSTRQAHSLVAAGVAGLFGLNTVTGVWNLWDARKEPAGRLRRYLHSALMIVSDAGFVAVGATAPDDDGGAANGNRAALHRTLAITSMSAALAGYAMMLIWKD